MLLYWYNKSKKATSCTLSKFDLGINRYPRNKLIQNKGKINLTRRLNSATNPWTRPPFNCNITLGIKGKIIDVNIRSIIYSLLYNTLISEN